MGGAIPGCVQAVERWFDGGPLTGALATQREDFLARLRLGDLAGVRDLIRGGLDPWTHLAGLGDLTHHLAAIERFDVDWTRSVLLPALSRAARNRPSLVNRLDESGDRPAHRAIVDGASAELILTLCRAGADLTARDGTASTPADLVLDLQRADLAALLRSTPAGSGSPAPM
jgi:hypothetical protein